jgi:hypothetical protein
MSTDKQDVRRIIAVHVHAIAIRSGKECAFPRRVTEWGK